MSTTSDARDNNPSPKQNVVKDGHTALQNSTEHHHDHVQDNIQSRKSQENDVAHSYDAASDGNTVHHRDSQDSERHRKRHADMRKELAVAVDPEQNNVGLSRFEEDAQSHTFSTFYKKYRVFFHLFIWAVFTGWWIAGLLLHGTHDSLSSNTGWLKPFLLEFAITLRIVFFYVPILVITKPIYWAWETIGVRFSKLLPEQYKIPLAAVMTVSVFVIGGFASPESEDNTRDNRAVCTFLGVSISPCSNTR